MVSSHVPPWQPGGGNPALARHDGSFRISKPATCSRNSLVLARHALLRVFHHNHFLAAVAGFGGTEQLGPDPFTAFSRSWKRREIKTISKASNFKHWTVHYDLKPYSSICVKVILKEKELEREGIIQGYASHSAEPVLLEGSNSRLAYAADETTLEGNSKSKEMKGCNQLNPAELVVVGEPCPSLISETEEHGVKGEMIYINTKEMKGSNDLWSAEPALPEEPNFGLTSQEEEDSFQVEITSNVSKELKEGDDLNSVEPYLVEGPYLDLTSEAEEYDFNGEMTYGISKETKEGNDRQSPEPSLVVESYPRLLLPEREEDASLSQLPYYSGWETLSIEEALHQMAEVYSADNYVEKCVCLLQKCKRNRYLVNAKRVYSHICNNGLEVHVILGSYLVSMFVDSGSFSMAQQVFNKLLHHNEYSWTYLIQGYIEGGDPEHSLDLFFRMREAGILPSKYTFGAILKACARLKCIEKGQQIHTEIAKEGLQEDLFVGRTLVDFYAKCGLFAEARGVFDELPGRDIYLWTALNAAYVDRQLHKESLECLEDMQVEGLSPDAVTFIYNLKACGSIKDLKRGYVLHIEIVKEGFDLDHFVGNTLVDMYAKCGSLSEAWRVLNKMSDRDVVSWTALITGCVEFGLGADALKYLEKMQEDNVSPNAFTHVSCLKACGSTRALDRGRKIHAKVMKEGLYMDYVVCNSLVDMYAKCGSLEEAHNVFDKLAIRDIISWTSLVSGYADHGPIKEALKCFEQMQVEGVSPNIVTFVCCLKACASMGDLDMGRKLHNDLVKEGFEDYLFVGNSLLGMYARCRSYSAARAVFDRLPGRDVVSWTALIAEYAEDGLGEEVLKAMEQMHSEGLSPNSVTYVCSLKACGSIGAMHQGRKLHAEITKRGLETNPFILNELINMYAECGKPIDP